MPSAATQIGEMEVRPDRSFTTVRLLFFFSPLISLLCQGCILSCADSSPLKYRVTAVAVSSNDKQVVSGGWDKSVKLWNVETGKEISTMSGHSDGWDFFLVFPPLISFICRGCILC